MASTAGVFAHPLYPLHYLIYSLLTGAYDTSSVICATLADRQIGGLDGKTVMDVGCGFGTTTEALSAFSPWYILAIDSSDPMTSLMRQIFLENLKPLLADLSKRDLHNFGGVCELVIQDIRAAFEASTFKRCGGILQIKTVPSQFLSRTYTGAVDAVIGNHFIHWPIKDVRDVINPESERVEDRIQATAHALAPIASVVKSGGSAVFSTMHHFVEDDVHPGREAMIQAQAATIHPVVKAMEEVISETAKTHFQLDISVGSPRPRIIQLSWLPEACKTAGFRLEHVQYQGTQVLCDALDSSFMGIPMRLGSYDLSWNQIKVIMDTAYTKVKVQSTLEQRRMPQMVHHYFLVLTRI